MRPKTLFVAVLFVALTSLTSFSQQTNIPMFSAFEAFSYLSTPSINLTQRGFDSDFGVNVRPWLTLGFDFSYNNGGSSLLPNYLNAATQAKLAPFLPLLPPGFALATPYNISTYTYEGGPQFNYRHFRKFTLFARPALGALHATATPAPNKCSQPQLDCAVILTQISSLLLNGQKSESDTVVFYGFGGGVTWETTPHFGIRVATDYVHYDFFSNLLNGGRNSVRLTIGTKFSFGKNIVK